MINFSFVTVAKGRIPTFTQVCDSIWAKASNPEQVEHIVAFDYDDEEMELFCLQYQYKFIDRKIKLFPVKVEDYENRNMHRDYWNPVAREAKGNIVFGLCNDTIMMTEGYDQIMLDALKSFKEVTGHSVCQFLVDDDSGKTEEYPKNWFCSWIILSRNAVITMDGLAPKELPFQGADRAVYQIFNRTLRPSQINLRDRIVTQHISHYTGRAEVDSITKHRPKNFNNPCILSPFEYGFYLNKVNSAISEEVLS